MSANNDQDHRFEELKKVLVRETHRTEEVAHKLADDLTAIGGYAEIIALRTGPEVTLHELKNILDRAKNSMLMLQICISNLQEAKRRYSG